MDVYRFDQVIDVTKHAQCATCNTYIYTLPCEIDVDFGDYLTGVGNLKYPLRKVKMVRMQNENLVMTSRVGRRWLEVKFHRKMEQLKPDHQS